MKISILTGQDVEEPEVIIRCWSDDPSVQQIVHALHSMDTKLLCQGQGETVSVCISNVLYIESVDRKTFLYTEDQVYEIDKRLYELERTLESHSFFRASKAIIINLKRVRSLRPEFGSRLLLTMDNGEQIVVSRQYAGKIKHTLEVL